MNTPKSVSCPTCGKRVEWTAQSEYRPFCSKRCQLIDLGEWVSEGHRIPSEGSNTDLDDHLDSDKIN